MESSKSNRLVVCFRMASQLIPVDGVADDAVSLVDGLSAGTTLFSAKGFFCEFTPDALEDPEVCPIAFISCAKRLLDCGKTPLPTSFAPWLALALPLSDVAAACVL